MINNGFGNHSTLGKVSLILAILTIIFFIIIIISSISMVIFNNMFISIFSSIFSLLMFIFSLVSIILGAISYWGKEKDRYGLYAFIIGLVFLILVFVTIAISATVYVYVSGMLGQSSSPNMTPYIHLIGSESGNNLTLNIVHISEKDISWSDVSYTLTDTTDLEEINCNPPDNEVTVSYNYQYLEEGKSIFIYGGINDSDELESNNDYFFTLIYNPTGETMYSYSWTQ